MLKKHKSRIVGFLLLWCLSPVNGKEVKGTVSWSSPTDSSIHVLSMITGEHLAYFENHIDTLQSFIVKCENSNLFKGELGKLFVRDGLWLATFSGSGRVFEIDTFNNTIDRQDRTFYQGYNFYAYQFQRKDTIFSFGGYGFWIENNLLTYFSEARREWNYMSNAPFPIIKPDKYEQNRLRFYDKGRDVFYAEANNVLYAFDFITYTWSKKGTLSSSLKGVEHVYHRMTDTTLLVMSNIGAWEIDFYGNRIIDRGIDNGLIYNLTGPLSGFNCMYTLDKHTLLIPKISDVISVGYSFEYLVTKMQSKGQVPLFLSSAEKYLQFAFGVFSVLLILFLILKSRSVFYLKSRKIKTIHKNFSLTQMNTLRQLLSGPLLAEDLNSILNVQEKSWEVQRRQRSILIKELNELGVKLLNSELVLREKSPTDKRQVVYVINSQIQDQLAQLLP